MLLKIEEIARQIQGIRVGKKVVFCSGTFDILHSAHIDFLSESKSHGDILIVGVNSDENVKKRKGPTRPVTKEEERAFIVSSIYCVDFVFIKTDEMHKEYIIEKLKPEVMIFNNDLIKSEQHSKRRMSLKRKFKNIKFITLRLKSGKKSSSAIIEYIKTLK